MTALLVLGLCFAGIALILGFWAAKDFARALLAVALGVAALDFLRCWLAELWESYGLVSSLSWFWPVAAAVLLIAAGGVAWKTRTLRGRRLAELRRCHMHPRHPAPLPPPSQSDERWPS